MSYPGVPGARPSSKLSARNRMCARSCSGWIFVLATSRASGEEVWAETWKIGRIADTNSNVPRRSFIRHGPLWSRLNRNFAFSKMAAQERAQLSHALLTHKDV